MGESSWVMAHNGTFHQVNHVFRNVGGVVRDPLQVTGRREERQPRLDHLRRALHLLDQLIDEDLVEAVHLVVEPANQARLRESRLIKESRAWRTMELVRSVMR